MFKGVWWLIAVWSSFAVLAVAHRTEAFSAQSKAAVKMVEEVLPEGAFQDLDLEIKDIGFNLSSCSLQRFSRSLGVPHATMAVVSCSGDYALA